MRTELLIGGLLTTTAFTLATVIHPGVEAWSRNRRSNDSFLGAVLGESQKMFANHFFIKADAYFHSGYYPSIFEHTPVDKEIHILGEATGGVIPVSKNEASADHDDHGHALDHGETLEQHAEEGFMGKPKDWLDQFGRHFRPNRHTHLGEESESEHAHGHSHAHGHAHAAGDSGEHDEGESDVSGMEREMLPWLRISASMDPQRVQTYVVGAYFLRNLKRDKEAEVFLREGLKANPQSYEILLELGRLMNESRNDPQKACNIWEAAIRFWREQEGPKPLENQNLLPYVSILAQAAKVEETRGNYLQAAGHLRHLLEVTSSKESVQQWLQDVQTKAAKP